MVLKEVIFNISYIWWVWWSLKKRFLTVYTLGICGGLKVNDFVTVFTLSGCVGLEIRDY